MAMAGYAARSTKPGAAPVTVSTPDPWADPWVVRVDCCCALAQLVYAMRKKRHPMTRERAAQLLDILIHRLDPDPEEPE